MIVRYMITCFATTFETFTEIESLQGPSLVPVTPRIFLFDIKQIRGVTGTRLTRTDNSVWEIVPPSQDKKQYSY